LNPQLAFYGLASALSALVLWVLWRSLRRSAASQPGAGATPGFPRWTAAVGVGLLVLVFGLYGLRGNPDALSGDRVALSEQLLEQGLPPPGETAEALYQTLQAHLKKQPGDPRALVLKARLDMQAERFAPAVVAFQGALAGRSKVVNDAGVWVEYAEAVGMAQGRTLAGEPQRLLLKALELDGRHPQALDLAGSAAWETGDYASAVAYWKRLLLLLPPGSPRHAPLQSAIERAEKRLRFALPVPRP
jgi:cytochrome c-type biogenesis protein CcmH